MMETFAVIGAGTMGNGIANVAARSGLEVILCDVKPEFLARGMQAIDASLSRDVVKQRLNAEDKNRIIRRIRTMTELEAVREADFKVLFEGFNDSKYRPCPLLKKYVAAGWLGKKSGRGFYQYEVRSQ